MELIADRFAIDDERAIDLATGERVWMLTSAAGGVSEQAAWADRCRWLSTLSYPPLARLVDYGGLGETRRFEAWAAEPGWRGAARVADQCLSRVSRFLLANGRTPLTPSQGYFS